MSLSKPSYIENARISGAKAGYEWNNDISLEVYGAENLPLFKSIDEVNFKAKMALGLAVTEWTVWRFEGLADLQDAHNRIEAGWCAVIDPIYSKSLKYELSGEEGFQDREIIKGPLELGLFFLGVMLARFRKGSIYLAQPIMRQSLLARQIMPDKKVFSDWLSKTLKHSMGIFPRGAAYNKKTEVFDASSEQPVPREFFNPEFKYTEAAADQALKGFLQKLDFSKNPYLRSPQEMMAEGFKGSPYTL